MVMTFVETAEVESSEFVEDWGAEAAREEMGEGSELISQRGFSSREIDPRRLPQAASRLKSLAGVLGKPVEWVWDRVVPRGKLTLITGESGAGKSFFVLDVVAAVTRGKVGPNFSAESRKNSLANSSEGNSSGNGSEGNSAQGNSAGSTAGNGVLLFSAGDCST